jgi:hypothetical protein
MNYQKPNDYVEVADRIREFRELYPTGSLTQVNLQFLEFGGKSWVVYTAAAYRTPDDPQPGIGTAWEAVPGLTPYTKNSELQNAETAAWGRAMVAALAVDTKKIASAEEVRARTAERQTAAETPNWVERARTMDYASLKGWYVMAQKGGATAEELAEIEAIGKEKTPGAGTQTATGGKP